MPLVDQIRDEVLTEIDIRKDRHFNGLNAAYKRLNYRWLLNGSAGKALEWFEQIAEEHPNATRKQWGDILEARIKAERTIHPGYYTTPHLKGVLAIVKGTYNESEHA